MATAFFVSLAHAAARCHKRVVAHDVFSCRSLVWCEEFLLAERSDVPSALSPPTWKDVNVQTSWRTSHFQTELSRPIVAPTHHSVKSFIARIRAWYVKLARSTLPLELPSPTALFFENDFGRDVNPGFVPYVDDAGFSVRETETS